MGGQRDQETSPGYPGPSGLDQEDAERQDDDRGILERVGDLFSGRAAEERAENQSETVGTGMPEHVRQDIGLDTADVMTDPYSGSAGSQAMDDAAVPPSATGTDTITSSAAPVTEEQAITS